jgi:putative peptidoglycan lipid II flippase
VIIPLSIFLIILRAQAVRVILGTGRFDWEATILTARALGYFSISLFAQCFVFLLNQAFFAFKDTKTPLLAASVAFFSNLFFIFLFASPFALFEGLGVAGVALAFSLASILEASILIFKLGKRIGEFEKDIIFFGLKIVILSVICGVVVQLVKTILGNMLDLSFGINVLLQGFISLFFGVLIYVLLAHFLKINELREFKKFFNK